MFFTFSFTPFLQDSFESSTVPEIAFLDKIHMFFSRKKEDKPEFYYLFFFEGTTSKRFSIRY